MATAANSNGNGTVETTTVVNSIQGEKELSFTVKNVYSAAMDCPIKIGAHLDANEVALAYLMKAPGVSGARLEFSSPNFATPAQMFRYFQSIRTLVAGIRVDSDNTVTMDGRLVITEKAPDGEETVVNRLLNKYKLPLGGGTYANTLEVPAKDLRIGYWPALDVLFKSIPVGATVTFYLPIKGWNKPSTLSPLRQSNI